MASQSFLSFALGCNGSGGLASVITLIAARPGAHLSNTNNGFVCTVCASNHLCRLGHSSRDRFKVPLCVRSSRVSAFPWVFVVNHDGSLGFSLSPPSILVRIRPPSESLFKGEPCAAPKPTHRHTFPLGARVVLRASNLMRTLSSFPFYWCVCIFFSVLRMLL